MSWASNLDRMCRVIRDTFPTSGTLLPKAGGSYPLTGVYDEAAKTVAIDPQTGLNVTSTAPRFEFRLADLAVEPKAYDRITIGSVTFEITGCDPDGSGMAVLSLVEA